MDACSCKEQQEIESSPEKVFELLATIQEEWQRIPEKHKYIM